MTKTDIIKELEKRGYNKNAAVTQQTLFSEIQSDQLFSNTNRLNAGWGRGKVVIATFSSTHTKSEYVDKWKKLVENFKDQYLCIEINENPSQWEYYDWQGNQITYVDIFPLITPSPKTFPLQTIYYGAPGTGKSHKVKEITKAAYPDKDEREKFVFRTTFHPDYDYASFVGCYKPTKNTEQTIVSKEELVKLCKEYANRQGYNNQNLTQFGFDFYKSIQKVYKDDKTFNYSKLLSESGVTDTSASSYVTAGIELHNNLESTISPITYSFVPQVFTNAYIKAWNEMKNEEPKQVYLVIEEINRGNCAQIFGDLFQLLDRGDNGKSEYPVDADEDLKDYLIQKLGEDSEGIKDGKLCLPPNLNILATMNTSDQSLFPMDSAFKRRWEWEYVPIKKGTDKNGNELDWRIGVQTGTDWWDFIPKINAIIASMTSSADKQLGYFFCKADDKGVISYKTFVNKVCFYLWNDVFKDYGFEDKDLFRYKETINEKEETKDLTFPDFFNNSDEDGICKLRVDDFIQKVLDWKSGKGGSDN